MAITNYDRVGKALELLRDGLRPFVERELRAQYGKYWIASATSTWRDDVSFGADGDTPNLDAAPLLRLMWEQWNDVFRKTLGHAERSLVSELRDVRNKWAHQEAFSSDDAYRALDSAGRLLSAISAPQAEEIERMKMELLRLRFDEQVRSERRKSAGTAIESAAAGGLKPWREVVTPHRDVASGRYQQAEFAADLWQVHLGQGSDEYRDPLEFFRRTYLTESLKAMLVGAARRMSGRGGDPVVQLQTNFGGGKTHSMLALYHLFAGVPPHELPGMDAVLKEAGDHDPAQPCAAWCWWATRSRPATPSPSPTARWCARCGASWPGSWAASAAYDRIAADDDRATNPGDELRKLFVDYGPCLILIDEWVAYARQLHDGGDLPGGTFETQFTFAQALTESARLAPNCLLVISLPASDTAGSPHTRADDVEVGGQRGREALDRLRNVVGRVESSWRPASAEEGFEIVRRRLFEPLSDPAQFKDRDVVARAFADFYRSQQQEFPPECRDADYEKRIARRLSHPPRDLRPALQRLVHAGQVPAHARRAAADGGRHPQPVGEGRQEPAHPARQHRHRRPARPVRADPLPLRQLGAGHREGRRRPQLAAAAARRRAAQPGQVCRLPPRGAHHLSRLRAHSPAPPTTASRTAASSSAPCMPGESPAVFGDALRRLAAAATYLYQDGPHYWYSTQPTVTKLAEDRAEQLKRDPDKVAIEVEGRLRKDLERRGDFGRIHAIPQGSQDVPDDLDTRLVVLGIHAPYSKEGGSAAEVAARSILEKKGSSPRLHRNTLVFLAADKTRLQDLDEAARKYLAWESILAERIGLDLTPQQVKQAEIQKAAADGAVTARLPETYQWLLVPVQEKPADPITFGGAAPRRPGPARRARVQEAAQRRAAHHRLCRQPAAHGARAHPPLARRPRRHRPAPERLRPVHLPPAPQGPRRPAAGHRERRRPPHLDAGQLRLRRELRRSRRPLPWPARRPAHRRAGG